jgi:hypothetical protein
MLAINPTTNNFYKRKMKYLSIITVYIFDSNSFWSLIAVDNLFFQLRIR